MEKFQFIFLSYTKRNLKNYKTLTNSNKIYHNNNNRVAKLNLNKNPGNLKCDWNFVNIKCTFIVS